MAIPALGVGTGQAVQDCGFGMFKIGKAQDALGFLAIDSGARLLLHGLWPPCHQTMIRPSVAVLSGLPVTHSLLSPSWDKLSWFIHTLLAISERLRLR